MSPLRRLPVVLTATLTALVLAGCTSTVEGTASPSPTTAAASSSSSSGDDQDPEGLAAGLLPADAFGAGAQVAPVSEADFRAGAALGGLDGVTITPEACADLLQQSQPSFEDLEDFAGQTATTGASVVAEVLTVGGADPGLGDVAATVAACPQATLTSPEIGTATLTFTALDIPDLGDGSAGLGYTTAVTGPDGTQVTVSVLVGIVLDGDRQVTVLSTAVGGTADTTGFADLLQQAFEHQADQLD